MTEKPYGKFTLDQLKKFTDFIHECKNLAPEFEKAIQVADPEKIKALCGEKLSWCHYYEMPFNHHLAWGALILDWQDELKRAAQSEDPQQYFFDFFESIDPDKVWQGGYKGQFKLPDLLGVVLSLYKTLKSIMVYQKSLSTLIEEVRQGNDKALFDAVRIDRTMPACPSISHRISIAELTGDNKFFLHLKSALKGPSKKHWIGLEELRYMMQALVETGADKLSDENLEALFVKQLKLYPSSSLNAQKNLRKHYTYAKKVNHRK